ncbi:hypothetical protein EDB19DRAFT_1893370 [Suillus lakei]|nr:hypothetical protein EDB19DRAFT_1893370 [Suillus lakei]
MILGMACLCWCLWDLTTFLLSMISVLGSATLSLLIPFTLIYNGFLGCSPLYPNIAIALRTLAAYRQAHRSCPRFSLQAHCKMLCYLHDMLYRPYLRSQFLAAYDAYLEILYRVDRLLKRELKHNTPNWAAARMFPTPALDFDWFATIDGNNSLKWWGSSICNSIARDDHRRPRTDYWISHDIVDKFKDEVKSRTALDNNNNPDDWEDIHKDGEVPGEIPFNCTAHWQNAGPEQCKKMFAVFEESGVFVAVCHHRFVLVVCDMIQSGELAKYALATVDHLMTVYGENGACTYDIGCAFSKTLSTSSLGPRAQSLALHMMVGAFHGHAHNRKCQLDWHLMFITGTGHTEGEGCEHIFSSSNELVWSTRHASAFHRHQSIEEHFMFWDADKYATLSNFLHNHYREATHLSVIKSELNLNDEDFVKFYNNEKLYLDALKQPPIRDRLCIRYVEVLDDLEIRRAALMQARIRVDTAYAKIQNAEALVVHMEIQLSIEECWAVGSADYLQFKEEATLGKYHAVLNDLEHLMVMRLFKLSKLLLSGTGYKLRQQIGKALQCCSEAIHNAINRYNTQAAALNPPHLKFFLGEFDLLHYSRTDIREADWTKPAYRKATTKHFKLLHAQEEVSHLNLEICCLCTFTHDEETDTLKVIEDLQSSNPLLASELRRQWRSCSAINTFHIFWLNQIEAISGFSGSDINEIITSKFVDADAS